MSKSFEQLIEEHDLLKRWNEALVHRLLNGEPLESLRSELATLRQQSLVLDALLEAEVTRAHNGLCAATLNLRRRCYKGKKNLIRRVLMRRVPWEARLLGRLKKGKQEIKSVTKAETSRRNGSAPVRPGRRPRGRPKAS